MSTQFVVGSNVSDEVDEDAIVKDSCLENRMYWCFLLSSIFTFVAGIAIVLIWRLGEFLFCRHKEATELEVQQQKEKLAAQQNQGGLPPGSAKSMNLVEGNFVTEAKDWAGELISGQTTTGRILVSTDTWWWSWIWLLKEEQSFQYLCSFSSVLRRLNFLLL